MQHLIGYFCVLLAAVLWGLLGPIAKFGLADGMTPLELSFYRAIGGGVLFAIHARKTGQGRIKAKDFPVFILFGITGIAVFFGSYQLAINSAGASVAAILLYTAPMWVAVLSRLFFKEPLSPLKLIALCFAMGGVSLVCFTAGDNTSISPAGIAFGLLSGFTYSLHYVFGKTYLKHYSAVTLYVWCLPIGALALLPWVDFNKLNYTGAAVIFAHSVLGTYAAYYVYCEALKRLEATRVAIVANAEPVVAAFLAWWWWNEQLGASGYLGAALVMLSVFLIVYDDNKRNI